MSPPPHARVSVPATSANLGPGYDVLGLALDLRLAATARPARDWNILIRGEGADQLPAKGENLMARAYVRLCGRRGWGGDPLEIEVDNPVPVARGLGSSATAIVAGMALAQLLHAGNMDRDELFREAVAMEGHPDNVAPAVFGGLQQVSMQGGKVTTDLLKLAATVKVLLVIPATIKSTDQMRAVVPEQLAPLVQAANDEALNHVLAGLADGDPEGLRYSEEDRRHQPYRLAVQPDSMAIFQLLQQHTDIAGAFLSGSGTTVGGWVLGDANPVDPIRQALESRSLTADVQLTHVDHQGVQGARIDG